MTLGPHFFSIYINNLHEGPKSNPKLFVDDSPLFSEVNDVALLEHQFNEDLPKLTIVHTNGKSMENFTTDPSKWAQKVIFNLKSNRPSHPLLVFNNSNVTQTHCQKHLGIIIDYRLTCSNRFKKILQKSIEILR